MILISSLRIRNSLTQNSSETNLSKNCSTAMATPFNAKINNKQLEVFLSSGKPQKSSNFNPKEWQAVEKVVFTIDRS